MLWPTSARNILANYVAHYVGSYFHIFLDARMQLTWLGRDRWREARPFCMHVASVCAH